jgi:hypothetical protein
MTTTAPAQVHQNNTTGARRRQSRLLQLIFAGAAALGILAMLALFDAARPDTTGSVLNSASVRLADTAVPAPASGPFGPELPQTPPGVVGGGGFAADDGNDQAQQQQQLAQQEIQQAEQQAEEQNEAAQQQALQDELQGQQTEQQAGQ